MRLFLCLSVFICGLLTLPPAPASAQDPIASALKNTFEDMRPEIRFALQEQLATAGFYQGSIDGAFGPNTLRALTEFCACARPDICTGLTTGEAVTRYFNDFLTRRLSCTAPPAAEPRSISIARFNRPDQCGTYFSGTLSPDIWFSGGEGGAIALQNGKSIGDLPATVFDGTIIEEGFAEPAGQVMVIQSRTRDPETGTEKPVIVVVRPGSVSLYEPCLKG